jgi:methyl-accepting chemotaxis protein
MTTVVANRPPPRRRRLVYGVYGFVAVLAIATMAAFIILPRYIRAPRNLEPHAALVQYLVERWSVKDTQAFNTAMARIEPRLRGKLSVFDATGKLIHTTSDPPLDAPTDEENRNLTRAKWSLDWGRIVVRSDDGSMIGVYAPSRPGFPWSYVLPLGAMILVLVGIASVWFSRRLAKPLDQLAKAARRFGAGDVTARANLTLADEVGDVGRAFDEMADRTASGWVTSRTSYARRSPGSAWRSSSPPRTRPRPRTCCPMSAPTSTRSTS